MDRAHERIPIEFVANLLLAFTCAAYCGREATASDTSCAVLVRLPRVWRGNDPH